MAVKPPVKITVTYNKKMFKGIDIKQARKYLRKAIQDIGSGTDGPLMGHFKEGQSKWQDDDPEYAKYKKSKFGSTEKFVKTGEAKAALKARTHKFKKYGVKWRKKKGYFLLTATLRKMQDGVNVYRIAQFGRFAGISGKVDGKDKSISKDQLFDDTIKAEALHATLKGQGAKVGSLGKFKKKTLGKHYGFDKGSTKRNSQNERLITINLPGDERYVKQAELQKYIKEMIKASGYKLK